MRLLTLLHTNRRKYDFVVEAHRYKSNCDLTFDTNWAQICEMGREIAPGDELFGRVKKSKNHPQTQSGTECAGAGPQPMPKPEQPGNGSHPPTDLPDETTKPGAEDQSDFVRRRTEDRQKYYSAWLGEERRKFRKEQEQSRPENDGTRGKG